MGLMAGNESETFRDSQAESVICLSIQEWVWGGGWGVGGAWQSLLYDVPRRCQQALRLAW